SYHKNQIDILIGSHDRTTLSSHSSEAHKENTPALDIHNMDSFFTRCHQAAGATSLSSSSSSSLSPPSSRCSILRKAASFTMATSRPAGTRVLSVVTTAIAAKKSTRTMEAC
ncbi:unnamed protein product, partial [Musa banksii]